MIQSVIDRWSLLPTWAKWALFIAAVVFIDAASVAARERNFVAGFAEHSVAIVLRYAALIGPLALAIWVGMRTAKRSKNWIGWVAGIAVWFVVGMAAMSVTGSIPGVGWRINAMNNSDCYVEWDGRSNPTIC